MFLKLLLFSLFFVNFFIFSQKKTNFPSKILEYSHQFKELNLKKASFFYTQKNWDSTIIYTQKQLNKNIKNIIIIDLCHYLRGISFFKKELFIEAQKQLSLISTNFKFFNVSKFYLAYTYFSLKKYNKAIKLYYSLSILPKKDLKYLNRKSIFTNLALCYLRLEKYDKADFYLQKSNKNIKDTFKLVLNYINTGTLYYNKSQKKQAFLYYKKAFLLSKKKLSKKPLNISKIDFFNFKKSLARNMSMIERDRKKYKKSLIYRDEMEQWKDSINDQNKIYEIAKKEKEFAVKEKQKEVTLLETENKLKETQRNSFIYIASGLLLLLLASGYFYSQKVKSNKIIASQKENLDALNTTKDKLFSIVSHDLRSSVNALKSSNGVLLDNLASKNIDALGNLLKKNSAIVNGAYGLLDNLLNWALLQTQQGYFHPTSMRLFTIVEHVAYNYKPLLLEKELHFENTVAKKDQAFADQESLKIVLRNLLDNAIKFSKPNGSIKIYSQTSTDGFCNLVVEDTGLGMSETTRLQLLKDDGLLTKKEHEEVIGTGLGLSLVKSMIKKNNGKFTIESELGKGTKMIVSLPKTKGNE